MRDLVAEIEAAARSVDPGWEDDRAERARAGFQRRRRRRARTRAAGAALSLALGLAGAGWLGVRAIAPSQAPPVAGVVAPASAPPRPRAAPPSERVHTLQDGSRAVALEAGSALTVEEDSRARAAIRLSRGSARFEVTRGPRRPFRVEAGRVAVTALGTVFGVGVRGARCAVWVREGAVQVEWPGGARTLAAGEEGLFPPEEAGASLPAPAPPPRPRPPRRGERAGAPGWVALARDGRHAESYALLVRTPPQAAWTAEQLLFAADAARLSGHPREAVPYLERLLREHRGDPRAATAAHSLGRLRLHVLGDPAGAAARFAEARALAPRSALAEDALAREVEAWARAGARDQARARAEEYLRLHPQGVWADAVRRQARRP